MGGITAVPTVTDLQLATRLEGALNDDLASFAAGMAAVLPAGRVGRLPVAGGWVSATGGFGSRGQGLALGQPVGPGDIAAAEDFLAGHGVPPSFEVCPLADASLLEVLERRGYRAEGFRNVYAHHLHDLPDVGRHVGVEVVDQARFPEWNAVILDGFGYTDEVERARVAEWDRMLLTRPEATLLVARLGGRAVGGANVLVHGRAASLGGTATLPDARGHGVQSALLAARLRLARASGCDLAVVTADPGGVSARNVERAGFRLAYTSVRMGLGGGGS